MLFKIPENDFDFERTKDAIHKKQKRQTKSFLKASLKTNAKITTKMINPKNINH